MRKRLTIILLVIVFSNILFAQVNVTFNVDMSATPGFNPDVHQVFLSGASQSAASGIGSLPGWPMPGTEPGFALTGPDPDNIYTITITGIVPGIYAYKYFLVENGNSTWDLGEWGGDPNRLISVESTDKVINNVWAQMADNIGVHLLINEIMASNAFTIADEDGDNEDWIEIFNTGSNIVNLEGFGLSDTEDNLFKWLFPGVNILPGQYMLVWASGKDRANPGNPLHTNFSISASGEPIILTRPDTVVIDMIPQVEHRTDISYGRLPNGGEDLLYLTTPTPGWENSDPGFEYLLQPVTFSHPDGFYASPFGLSITSPDAGTTIRYTLDGSEPTTQSALYQGPINIASRTGDPNTISLIPTNNNPEPGPPYFEGWQPPNGEVFKINVVRAKAFHDSTPAGDVITYTYLVDSQAEDRYSLPVFSLNTNAENLFDDDLGIYVHGNHQNYFRDGWERAANLTFFEKNGAFGFKEDIGIRLNGNTTRSRPRKSLRILAKGGYGNSWINYQLFPDKETDMYKRFILRNSGNDWDFSVFRDGVFQYLAKDLNVETQYYRPAILFINGEYWGLHNLRDKYDHRYFLSRYGLEENEITVLGDNSIFKWGVNQGKAHYDNLTTFIANNSLQNTGNYNHIKEQIDIESFIDYQLTHIFVKNTDWPGNNALYWRYLRDEYVPDQGLRDGRWRWMMLDTDFGFDLPFFYVPGLNDGPSHNTLGFAADPSGPSWPNPSWSTMMLRRLLENSEFTQMFINRYCDLLNTTFSTSHVVSAIDSISNLLAPEMEEHVNRWRRPTSLSEWNENVDVLRNFAQQRTGFQFQHLQDKFGLADQRNLTVNVSDVAHGFVKVNTIDIHPSTMGVSNNPWPWTGVYFSGVPVTLEAKAKQGYAFSHWSGDATGSSNTITVNITANTQITANFVVTQEQLIHYWFIGNAVENDTPLETIEATYGLIAGAKINFHSALAGYPFNNAHPQWRKASMERRNSPTEINYLPNGNNQIPFADANMRAIQVRQPFAGDGGENTLYFDIPTLGFREIRFQFAAKDEGAAHNLMIDYSISETENWITSGLTRTTYPLSVNYQLYEVDFSDIGSTSNNSDFRIRVRFTCDNTSADEGNRVTFNNFSVTGLDLTTNTETGSFPIDGLQIFPNPAQKVITIHGAADFKSAGIFDVSGRLIETSTDQEINVSGLNTGIYFIRVLNRNGWVQTARFIKK